MIAPSSAETIEKWANYAGITCPQAGSLFSKRDARSPGHLPMDQYILNDKYLWGKSKGLSPFWYPRREGSRCCIIQSFVSASGVQVRVGHAPPVQFSIHPCIGASCEQVYTPRPGSDTTCDRRAQYTRDSRWWWTGTKNLRMLPGNLYNICVRSNHWHRFSRLCLYLAREQVSVVPAHHS